MVTFGSRLTGAICARCQGLSPSRDDAERSSGVTVFHSGQAGGHHVVVEQDAVATGGTDFQQADVVEESVCN